MPKKYLEVAPENPALSRLDAAMAFATELRGVRTNPPANPNAALAAEAHRRVEFAKIRERLAQQRQQAAQRPVEQETPVLHLVPLVQVQVPRCHERGRSRATGRCRTGNRTAARSGDDPPAGRSRVTCQRAPVAA